MIIRRTLVAGVIAASVLSALAPAPAAADSLLYDNGPDAFKFFAGTGSANTINRFGQFSDEFVLGSAATLDRAAFAELTLDAQFGSPPNVQFFTATPVSVQWCVGTSAFGCNVGSGTARITATPTGSAPGLGHDFSSSFALPGLELAGGTYFLSLTNGTDSLPSGAPGFLPHNNDYWAATNPASGDAEATGVPTGTPHGTNNELSFQIYGTEGSGGGGGGKGVPEPPTLLLLMCGLLSLAFSHRPLRQG
jgi:hypothetical protein